MERAQMLLPFAEREYIDVPRCCRILGCSWTVIARLAESKAINLVDYRKRGWKKVRYAGVVEYCDRLRTLNSIADRRPVLSSPILRHRDEDILPFPLRDTIGAEDASSALGFASLWPVVKLIESGAFEAYQLMPRSPWRISLTSFQAWGQSVIPTPTHTDEKLNAAPRF
jgi:hypothetical protein